MALGVAGRVDLAFFFFFRVKFARDLGFALAPALAQS
jgi:hypothetical protein